MNLTRVLYVHGGLLKMGGTEAVMMNYYRHFDRTQIQVDFVLHGFGEGAYDAEVSTLGGKIYHVVAKGENYRENEKQLRSIMQQGNYQVVHSHMDAGNAQVLKIAKECGVPIRVSHSHNTHTQTSNPLKKAYNALAKRRIAKYATHLFACSDLAGKWLYGKHNFWVIHNAIDVEKFRFLPEVRQVARKDLKITADAPVIGHVGRFSYQKNHEKLIDIFAELLKSLPTARLLLIGEGETKDEIEQMVLNLGILDSVVFIAPNPNINRYMQAMDCFLLPSRFEGLPVVLVEAQAAGLPAIVSNTVSTKSKLTDLVDFVPLDADNSVWCKKIIKSMSKKRRDYCEEMKAMNFDISVNAQKMQHFYLTGEVLF